MTLRAAVAVVAILLAPSLAQAHAGNSDPDVVPACIGTLTKIVRVVGANGASLSAPVHLAVTRWFLWLRGPALNCGSDPS